MGKADEAKTVWNHALEIATPIQLYSRARGLQQQKQDGEAMELFKAVAQRAPKNVFGLLAQARIKSAAGDLDGALGLAKEAQTAAPNEQQKTAIGGLIKRLEAKQDINK
jgi:tetratricopeptide (TPR) repeat protein